MTSTQPYIKPYGPRFDRSELPYFKYRETNKLTKIKPTNCLAEEVGEALESESHQGYVEEGGGELRLSVFLYIGLGIIAVGTLVTTTGTSTPPVNL